MIQKDNNNNDNAVFHQELSLDELASAGGGFGFRSPKPDGEEEWGGSGQGVRKFKCTSGVKA